jgi:hypothetical protein
MTFQIDTTSLVGQNLTCQLCDRTAVRRVHGSPLCVEHRNAVPFFVGDGVSWGAGTDTRSGTVVRVTPKNVFVVEDEAALQNPVGSDEADALEFSPGGFVGHTSGKQRWAFKPGAGEPVRFSLRAKTGRFKQAGTPITGSLASWGNLYHGRSKHYDYNF